MMLLGKEMTARRLGRIAAGSAVALLLAGSMAAPAGAMTREAAKAHINNCFMDGGDPFYFEYWGVGAVGCDYGSWWTVATDGSYNEGTYGEATTAPGDRGKRAADADHGRQKSGKHKHKHKSRAGKRG